MPPHCCPSVEVPRNTGLAGMLSYLAHVSIHNPSKSRRNEDVKGPRLGIREAREITQPVIFPGCARDIWDSSLYTWRESQRGWAGGQGATHILTLASKHCLSDVERQVERWWSSGGMVTERSPRL